ncbi:hypothetical protein BBK36DRAFT_23295 [Trichoderma citrinoviride]|uniref:Uncharacterized protein n=1 Tax=Trichoderma citrinoviride TaxID=58853 RepID=A0A2T4B115_9HYPO|nr:hypothetical protein BBK36DRAFT_23295 [Trichoderma citrinoviride]PTB62990.1 hypothetical protein BBK36DRAFT_23295 [Trichoderma citrinoviride]
MGSERYAYASWEEALHEEIEPDFGDRDGAFKTKNPKDQRWQRRFVHVQNKESKFRKTVETVLVVHGWKTPKMIEPMSLIVLSVSLDCHKKDFRFESVRIWLAFDEDQGAIPPNSEDAKPEVVAYAPFVAPQNWHLSEEKIEEKTTKRGALSIEQGPKAGLELSKEIRRSHTRTHFDRGTADWMVDKNQRAYGVNWYCEQNHLDDYGVKPQFHIAVLLKRQHTKNDNKPVSFKGVFDMRVEAGFRVDFEQLRRRMFRGGKPEDEAIYYDPNMDDQVHGRNSVGERLRAKIDKNNLGELMGGPDGNWLSGIVDSNGDISGLDPLAPKTD